MEAAWLQESKGEVSALCEDGNARDYSSHQLSAGAGAVATVGGKTGLKYTVRLAVYTARRSI